MTIALAHHPVNWLTGEDEDLLQAEMLSDTGLSTDLYICGHIHNRDAINWQNNRHSLTTLVSGIGWPDGSTSHPEAHTYSSYVFNLDVNSMDVYVRSSNDAFKFEPDFRIYTQERNKRENKIFMPINSCKTQAYFNLGTAVGRSAKACYITEEMMIGMERAVQMFGGVRNEMEKRLSSLKYDMFDLLLLNFERKQHKISVTRLADVEDFWFKETPSKDAARTVRWIAKQYPELMYMQFTTYLQCMCRYICEWIESYFPNTRVRTHFRQYNRKDDFYYQNSIFGQDFMSYEMKPLLWGQLLEKAYEAKRPLIASVNSTYCDKSMKENQKKKNGKWLDFITVIPDFSANYYKLIDRKTGKLVKSRPLLTFGITVYQQNDRSILYLMDFLRIDKMIGQQLNQFLYYMPLDLKKYVDRVN